MVDPGGLNGAYCRIIRTLSDVISGLYIHPAKMFFSVV